MYSDSEGLPRFSQFQYCCKPKKKIHASHLCPRLKIRRKMDRPTVSVRSADAKPDAIRRRPPRSDDGDKYRKRNFELNELSKILMAKYEPHSRIADVGTSDQSPPPEITASFHYAGIPARGDATLAFESRHVYRASPSYLKLGKASALCINCAVP